MSVAQMLGSQETDLQQAVLSNQYFLVAEVKTVAKTKRANIGFEQLKK